MKEKLFTGQRLRRRIFGQLWMLALQFILGMLLNMLGADSTGTKHTVYMVILILHIINAIGLVEGGIYIILKEKSTLSYYAAVAIIVTFCCGVLTTFTQNDIWSFAMACGFLVSSWLYGVLYIHEDRRCTLLAATNDIPQKLKSKLQKRI